MQARTGRRPRAPRSIAPIHLKNSPQANHLNTSPSGWSGIGLGNVGLSVTRSLHVSNSTSYATGRHNMRFGGEFRRYRTGFASYFLTGGQANFTGQLFSNPGLQNAGNAYAEFLMGQVASWRRPSGP